MSRVAFALAIMAVVAVAAWAYHVNYRTKTTLREVERLRTAIADERETVEVLRIEWSYMNAPERLAALVKRENKVLGLVALSPDNFDDVAAVPFPPHSPTPVPAGAARDAGADAVVAAASPPLPPGPSAPLPLPKPAGWRP